MCKKIWLSRIDRGKTIETPDATYGAGERMAQLYKKEDSQIYRDVLIFATEQKNYNIKAFEGVQWQLHKEAVDSLGGITKMKQDLIENVEKNKNWFMPHLGHTDKKQWEAFVNDLEVAINNKVFFKAVD